MKKILNQTLVLKPENSKTNVPLSFSLEKDYERLFIRYRYFPKKVEDMDQAKREILQALEKYVPEESRAAYSGWRDYAPLVNLVTLSLDYEKEYLGCAHRHAPEQKHIISAAGSSPGFVPHRAAAGNWKIVLNVHAIIGNPVTCQVEVIGLEKGEAPDDSI